MRTASLLHALPLLAAPAAGQSLMVYSLDYHGPLIGTQASGSTDNVTEADLLDATPILLGGTDAPKIILRGADLGLVNFSNCDGHPGGDPCGIDVDAYSDGQDALLKSASPVPDWRLFFTVDEYARGNPLIPVDPSIGTEALAADVSGDVWCTIYLPPPPLGPNTTTQWARVHALTVDGDGKVSASGAVAPGHAMVEPNIPGQGLPNASQDTGSHIDALHIGASPSFTGPKYFSLDAAFTDPFGYVNSGSAAAQGVSPSDVLLSAGGTISTYASATQLGLDPLLDDLDGLVLNENGVAGYQESKNPYEWESGADMVLFSLRRGSDTLGKTDSLLGLPIEPGDVLMPPVENGNGRPGILVAAEVLGLRTQRESGSSEQPDDLSAMAITDDDEDFIDCNNNQRPDSVDIMLGGSRDDNQNGIPDECEDPGDVVCGCGPGKGPCANDGATDTGCANSTGLGARMEGRGSSSLYMDDLSFEVVQLPPSTPGILFYAFGAGPNTVLADGLTCATGVKYRIPSVQLASAFGVMNTPIGLAAYIENNLPSVAHLLLGASYYFQFWYRDPVGPCGSTSNVTNMVRLVVTP